MVTIEELKSKHFTKKEVEINPSYYVSSREMTRFNENRKLNDNIYEKINEFTQKHNLKPKYEKLEEICQLSETSIKKSCAGTQKITRYFLYKFTVGLKMSLEEANEFFGMCGGVLRDDDLEDYICIKALEDKDDIITFIDQFNKYVKEYDKFQTKDKLKKLYE